MLFYMQNYKCLNCHSIIIFPFMLIRSDDDDADYEYIPKTNTTPIHET